MNRHRSDPDQPLSYLIRARVGELNRSVNQVSSIKEAEKFAADYGFKIIRSSSLHKNMKCTITYNKETQCH